MKLLLLTSIPLMVLVLFGVKLKKETQFILQILSIPFVLLVAFYSFLMAVVVVAGYVLYLKIFKPKNIKDKDDDYPQIRWE
tara:strand:- start:68156 stop:68398 length:243 start_codon:yes stop_codon:yes gene_type:complete